MKYSQEIIDRIRDNADIVEVIGEDVSLKQKGSNYVGFSPFKEERTPSFVVSPVKRIYKDFSTGKSGNVFTWMMEFHGLTFVESILALAKKYSINLPDNFENSNDEQPENYDLALKAFRIASDYFNKSLFANQGKSALSYFLKRGFTKDTMNSFLLGYAPNEWNELSNHLLNQGFNEQNLLDAGLIIKKDSGGFYDRFRDRAIFTIRDFLSRPVGFGARRLNEDKNQPKYINSPQSIIYDKSNLLYGLSESKNAIRNSGSAILVEGYTDVITLHQAGIENVVASSGTALTLQQIKLLHRYTNKLFIIYDSDSAGINAAERGAELAIENKLEPMIVLLPEGEDPDTLVKENGPKALQYYLSNAENFIEFKIKNRKSQHNLSTPAEKANIIRELVKTIAKIPDKLQHHFYLRRLATLMELSESQIDQVYEEKNEITRKIETTKPQLSKDIKNKQFAPDIQIVASEFQEVTISDALHKLPKFLADTIKKEELIILKILLTKDNPLFYIESKYDIVVEDFETEEAKKLFSKIYEIAYENDDVFDTVISSDDIEQTIRDILSSIALPVFEASTKWNEFGEIDETSVEHMLEDSLKKLKLIKLQRELTNLSEALSSNTDISVELLKEQMILSNKIQKLKGELSDTDN